MIKHVTNLKWKRTRLLAAILMTVALFGSGLPVASATGPEWLEGEQSLGSGLTIDVGLDDFNRDGKLDVFVLKAGSNSESWVNQGPGTFLLRHALPVLPSEQGRLALGDINGDSKVDAFAAAGPGAGGIGTNFAPVMLGGGNGTFGRWILSHGANRTSAAIGDMNGDGRLDIFTGMSRQNPVVHITTSTGNTDTGFNGWQLLATPLAGPGGARAHDNRGVALGDLDGDGDLDVVAVACSCAADSPDYGAVLKGSGTGTFTQSQTFSTSGANNRWGVALGDLNGDGTLDAFTAHGGSINEQPNQVWLNDGNGTLSLGSSVGNAATTDVALGDVDLDGDLDAVTTDGWWVGQNQPNRLWLNNGSGQFTDSGITLGEGDSRAIALGDLDGDGDLDAVVGNNGTNKVYFNPLLSPDADGDEVPDNTDNCPATPNADQLNTDGDAQGNACDSDDDNDGIADAQDAFPLDASESVDTDGDLIGNNTDTDDDGDGQSDLDEQACSSDPLSAASMSPDLDGDSSPNCVDADDDRDGVADTADAFPLDASEQLDTDGDGTGNNADADDDGDGQYDVDEIACGSDPLSVSSLSPDYDADYSPNCVDTDDDNDGVLDTADPFPVSDRSGTVIVRSYNTGITNKMLNSGATFNDLIAQAAAQAKSHGQFMSMVSDITDQWRREGLITAQERSKIIAAAAQAIVP